VTALGALSFAASCARFGFEDVSTFNADVPLVLDDGGCTGAGCSVVSCAPGYADCDADASNGCEAVLDSIDHCGGCNQSCAVANGEATCSAGACGFVGCSPGFGDCDGDIATNGCERPLDSLTSCGGCDVPCALPDGETTCNGGVCALTGCGNGFDDCDGDASNGCEAPLDTLADCGGCGAPCASASCSGGVCSSASCAAFLADCDADGAICETDLRTLSDCVSCGVPCGDQDGRLANATATCASGGCGIAACDPGFDDCDSSAATGCEAQIGSNAHCGGCNLPCDANETCSAGSCVGQFASYAPSNVDTGAFDPAAVPDVVLDCGTVTIDTSSLSASGWCGSPAPALVVQAQDSGPELLVVSLKSLVVAAGTTLRATGARPLALAVFGDVDVAGSIDVGASGATGGAGNHWNCFSSLGVNGTGTSTLGGGGGGGGAFRASGGRGGNGSFGQGGIGGVARGGDLLSPLIPGCNGGWGGGCGANPGGGGGALQIAATGRIDVTGSLLSRGGDGVDGCGTDGGASGGGSGGAILLEAHQVFISGGTLLASGGSGGRGANGGTGGLGSSSGAGQDGTAHLTNGGGGGGGSAGRIRIAGAQSCSLGGTITPPASVACP
jgi:hypothetical protein